MKIQRSILATCTALALTTVLGTAIAAAAQGKELAKHPSDSKAAATPQRLAKSFPAPHQVNSARAVPAPNAPLLILYDQTDSADPNGFSSQNFETAYDVYDSQGADDFVVTGGGWVVTTVTTPGAYFNGTGPAVSVHVTFYDDAGGLPGAVVPGCDYPAVTTFVDSPSGTLATTLPTPCTLTAGTKWVAVQVNMNFGAGGQWGWTMRDVQSGSPAAWNNPGDGFGSGCLSYTSRATCEPTTATSPDNAYRLDGTIASCIVDGDCADGNLCNGVETCVAGTCTPGTPVNCDDGLFCTTDTCTTSTGVCSYAANLCSDGDGCTVDFCDEAADTCTHVAPPPIHLCNTGSITINDVAAATPYPSTIAVSGLGPSASLCSVQLNGITHTYPDDIDVLLVGPVATSQNAEIMSDVGGGTDVVGLNLTLTDGAAASLPDAGPLVSGTYKPTNAGGTDTFPAPAPVTLGNSALSIFAGNPNGTWSLYVRDQFSSDTGSMSGGWCVNLVVTGCTSNADCNDGNLCNGNETCVAGACAPGTAVNCDDGLFCTVDSCDPPTGSCAHAPNPCSDGDGCTVDTCDEATDSCGHVNACTQVCNPGSITINDSAAPPTIATPYPSSIPVAAGSGIFNLISVQLLGLSHTFPSDIDILLAAPAGPNAIIMSDAGGSTAAVGVNLTLTDSAAAPIPAVLVSGTYQPTNGTGADAWPAPAPVPLGGSALSVFTGTAPNGSWDLYIVDDANIDSGSIAGGWCLNYRLTCTTAADCNDGDPCTTDSCVATSCVHSPVGTPGLASDLTSSPDKQTITWSSAINATRYDAVSGVLSALPVGPGGGDETCFPDLPSASLVDATVPAPGVGLWYLVRGDNDCTAGSYGNQSDGSPRVTTTCP